MYNFNGLQILANSLRKIPHNSYTFRVVDIKPFDVKCSGGAGAALNIT